MNVLEMEFGVKRVSLVKKHFTSFIDIELCLDAWKEHSLRVNQNIPASRLFNKDEDYFKYKQTVKVLGNYFDAKFN